MALNMTTAHTNSTTYSASVVCHSKSLCAIFGLELGLDVVGRLASVVQGELLQEALVGGLWEETLFIQQGHDAHLLQMGGGRRGRECREGEEGAEEGEGERGRRPNKERKEGPCVHVFWQLYLHGLYMKHSLPISLKMTPFTHFQQTIHVLVGTISTDNTNRMANWGLHRRALV